MVSIREIFSRKYTIINTIKPPRSYGNDLKKLLLLKLVYWLRNSAGESKVKIK